jgi:rod shape-determining protein MreD
MRRAVLSAAVIAVALVLQLTLVNRLTLPGGGAPDLVLLVVVALGLYGGPAAGALTGFCAGLALDLAPPASYLIGEYALVFCVVGYLCGRIRPLRERSALLAIAAAMAGAVVGEVLYAALGLALRDPQVTLTAVRQVLPSSVVYDLVLSPFSLYLTVRGMSWAEALGRDPSRGRGLEADGARLLARVRQARPALPGAAGFSGVAGPLGGAGLLGGAGWLSGPMGSRGGRRGRKAGRAPSLRESAARPGDGWVGSAPAGWRTGTRRPAGRPPRLRPGSGRPGSAAALPRGGAPARPVNLKLGGRQRRAPVAGGAGGTLGRPRYGPPGAAYRRGGRGPSGTAFRGLATAGTHGPSPRRNGPGPPGSAFRGGNHGPAGLGLRGGARGPSGSAFRRGSSGPSGSAFRAGSRGPSGPAFRGGSRGLSGPAFRGGSRGLPGPAFRGGSRGLSGPAFRGGSRGLPGPAFRGGSRGLSGPGLGGRGRPGFRGPSRSAFGGRVGTSSMPVATTRRRAAGSRFRPDGRMRGGSALAALRPAWRSRPVTLRLGGRRRVDGVLGGGVLGSSRPGRGLGARPVRLRLGGHRRGDGVLGGVAASRRLRGGSRHAAPHFRARPGGGVSLGTGRGLRIGKQARFRFRKKRMLASWTGGRLGGRSRVMRINTRRTGGYS